PKGLFGDLVQGAAAVPAASLVEKRLQFALNEPTDYDDTHPCLTDRLRALRQLPESLEDAVKRLPSPGGENAAREFLGEHLQEVADRVEAEFAKHARKRWTEQYQKHQKNLAELRSLREKAETVPLNEDERVDLAHYIAETEGGDRAKEEFARLYAEYPKNPLVNLLYGRLLAEENDPLAEGLLIEAMKLEPRYSESAMNLLGRFYYARGDQEALAQLRDKARTTMHVRGVVEESAKKLSLQDTLEPHGLSPEQLESLRRELSGVERLETAYLVGKRLPDGSLKPVLVGFHKRKFAESQKEPGLLVQRLVKLTTLPTGTRIYSPAPRGPWTQRLDQVPGSRVFERPR
ncbi:MAG TPA: hypothetical protein VMI31_10150, partial [Fimbriimonadaceae bacterium]|nr:hypothetical protein [Fimbriimonadaceae bacterium]